MDFIHIQTRRVNFKFKSELLSQRIKEWLVVLFPIMDLSESVDRRFHFSYLVVKDYSNHKIIPVLSNGFAQVIEQSISDI